MNPQDDMFEILQQIFQTVFNDPTLSISPAMTAKDIPGWDSFKHIDLLMMAEERFHISIIGDDLEGIENIGDLAALITSKHASS